MNRVEFTKASINLIAAMFLSKENPILDYVKRSDNEQAQLFLDGKSKCDGVKIISQHQVGKAVDIYFLDDKFKELVNPRLGWDYWHKYWEMKGGKPVIVFADGRKDNCHFEG